MAATALAQRVDAGLLIADVGHDALGGVGRGRGAPVGDEVQQRGVGLVADRADHRRAHRRDRADQGLVGERQQVLDRAAAPGHDDDHVDVCDRRSRAAPAPPSRSTTAARGPCIVDVGDLGSATCRPAAPGVLRARRAQLRTRAAVTQIPGRRCTAGTAEDRLSSRVEQAPSAASSCRRSLEPGEQLTRGQPGGGSPGRRAETATRGSNVVRRACPGRPRWRPRSSGVASRVEHAVARDGQRDRDVCNRSRAGS